MKGLAVALAVLFAVTPAMGKPLPKSVIDEEEENAPYTVPNLTASWADWNRTCMEGTGSQKAFGCQRKAELEAMLRDKGLCLNDEINFVSCKKKASVQTDSVNVQALIAKWNNVNSRCRGSDDMSACDTRNVLDMKLYKAGWCYGKKTDDGAYAYRWHQCTRVSYHP